MAAGATDKFKKLTNNFSTTLSGAIVGSGDSSMSLSSTTNLPTDTGSVFVVDRVNASGTATPTLREYVVGTVSGSNVTNLIRGVGNSTAQAHSTGAVVEQVVDQRTINDIVDGLLVSHLQTGAMIPNLPLTTPQITTGIKDANGNTMNGYTPTASAVNFVNDTNAATTTDPIIAAAGSDSAINLNIRGKGLAKTVTVGKGAVTIFPYDYVASGCVWSGLGYGSTLTATMTVGVVVINGNPLSVATIATRAFTASKDTYIDVLDNGDGTGLVVYTEVANNAASPALASNSIRIGIIVSGANIAAATSVNQGQETMVLPIASSIPYAVTDSLGNLICPRDPNRKVLGYRQSTTGFTTASTSAVQVTGLSCPVIVPTGRKVKITFFANELYNTAASGNGAFMSIWDGVVNSGAELGVGSMTVAVANQAVPGSVIAITTPNSSSKTYNAGLQAFGTGSGGLDSGSGKPMYILVELV